MKIFTTVYSLPVLENLSRQDKKKALRACQYKPFKSCKVWLAFSILGIAPLISRVAFYSAVYLLTILGYVVSQTQMIILEYFLDIIFLAIALNLFMQIYNPVISHYLSKYLAEQKELR